MRVASSMFLQCLLPPPSSHASCGRVCRPPPLCFLTRSSACCAVSRSDRQRESVVLRERSQAELDECRQQIHYVRCAAGTPSPTASHVKFEDVCVISP
eukprot:349473-Pleurochrysis_carterae.AAC.3